MPDPALRPRPLALLAVTLAACAGPADGPAPSPAASAPSAGAAAVAPATNLTSASAAADDLAARARAAGLAGEALDRLVALGQPVVVPAALGAFRLADVDTEDHAGWFTAELEYRRDDGACFTVVTSNDGLGDLVWEGAERRAVAMPALRLTADVHRASETEGGEGAGPGQVAVPWVDLGGASVGFHSAGSEPDALTPCRPLGLDEAAALVRGLRVLDPADEAALVGPVEETIEPDPRIDAALERLAPDASPEAVALAARGYDAAGPQAEGGRVAVQTLRLTPRRAAVLVTHADLPDDSVRDVRWLVALVRGEGGAWTRVSAGLQQRCQPGRGHPDWSPELCL